MIPFAAIQRVMLQPWIRSVGVFCASVSLSAFPAQMLAQAASTPPVKTPVYNAVSIKVSKADAGSWSTDGDVDRFSATNVSLKNLLAQATGVRRELISGIPEPIASARFDIEAKVVEPDVDALKNLTSAQRGAMVLAILLERFKLSEHIESKILPVYELQLAKSGPKFSVAASQSGKDSRTSIHDRKLEGTSITMATLADALTNRVDRHVVDKTGLTALYDLNLQWSTEEELTTKPDAPPLIFTALKEQLGLKLESAKGPVETLVVDHVEMPSEN